METNAFSNVLPAEGSVEKPHLVKNNYLTVIPTKVGIGLLTKWRTFY